MSGLDGLGAINDSKEKNGVISGDRMLSDSDTGVNISKSVVDQRLFKTDANSFVDNNAFFNYAINWFKNTNMSDIETDGVVYGTNSTFNMRVSNGSTDKLYKIIPCLNEAVVDEVLKLITDGDRLPLTNVILAYKQFTIMDKQNTSKIGIELIGLEEMYSINNAIVSSDGAIGLGNSFINMLCKHLNAKYKNEQSQLNAQNIGDSLSETGSNIGNSFKEGISQIKDSLGSLFASLGASKNNNNNFGDNVVNNETPYNNQIEPTNFGFDNSNETNGFNTVKDEIQLETEDQYREINESAGFNVEADDKNNNNTGDMSGT